MCFDLKTNAVAPFEYSAPADSAVDPEIFWTGDFNGKTYKTAGQIYREEAEPWTLEKTAEECWLQADKIEAAIKLYVENNGGIVNGVASDMTESASQVPLGCMGLDSIMGRINKPGVTMTKKASGVFGPTGEVAAPTRPLTYNYGFDGMFSDMYGVGAVKLSESLDLVVQLEAWDPTKNYQRTGLENEYYDILGVSIPSTSIPVSPGRNLAVVLETAAINNRQKKMGYNAARELLIRLGLDDKMD